MSPYCLHTAHLSSARIGKFISILHQTTTLDYWHLARKLLFLISILHQTTTICSLRIIFRVLFLISILHQTTTDTSDDAGRRRLFLISILHQTTTSSVPSRFPASCFLFQFYIKPQLPIYTSVPFHVVSYFNSTSNHNLNTPVKHKLSVVSYFNSTSNHNLHTKKYQKILLFLISILHQTTTSDMRFVDCHSVMWPNERYERRMTGRGSRNDAGFVFQRYFSLKVECTSRARNRYMFAK